ncbi:hypothetical protein CJ030_MR6G019679 [Morella rubra]|uniref:Uncharacterized protein n=1 Tax=Morella rubra TaxID=262757 RepID=A0A6A1VIR0_9ROSI|nr:hypothetical protein CJ030_MR6G019679 [Morella rubra]
MDIDLVFKVLHLNIPSAIGEEQYQTVISWFRGIKLPENHLGSLNILDRLLEQKTFTVLSSHCLPHAKTTGYFLVLIPLIAFCVRCIIAAFQTRVTGELKEELVSESEGRHQKCRSMRWKSALSDTREQILWMLTQIHIPIAIRKSKFLSKTTASQANLLAKQWPSIRCKICPSWLYPSPCKQGGLYCFLLLSTGSGLDWSNLSMDLKNEILLTSWMSLFTFSPSLRQCYGLVFDHADLDSARRVIRAGEFSPMNLPTAMLP